MTKRHVRGKSKVSVAMEDTTSARCRDRTNASMPAVFSVPAQDVQPTNGVRYNEIRHYVERQPLNSRNTSLPPSHRNHGEARYVPTFWLPTHKKAKRIRVVSCRTATHGAAANFRSRDAGSPVSRNKHSTQSGWRVCLIGSVRPTTVPSLGPPQTLTTAYGLGFRRLPQTLRGRSSASSDS